MFKFKLHFHFILAVLIGAMNSSCGGTNQNRPSPLTIDSIQISNTHLRIEYSSPAVKKRKIWGELVPYGEIWRTGANKATFIATDNDIKIEKHLLPAGKYSIFTIPTDSTWTIILNKDWDQWGAFNYNKKKDVLRLQIHPQKSDFHERMTFTWKENALHFAWEELSYRLKIDT